MKKNSINNSPSKSRLKLVRFSAMLRYGLYIPLASKLHFVPSIDFEEEFV